MLCPKCGKEMEEMWREDWTPMGGMFLTSVVVRCEDCDYDGTYDIDELGRESGHRQFFFG